VDKPSALYLAKSPAVAIRRTRQFFIEEAKNHPQLQQQSLQSSPKEGAFIALE
jgi:RES domain-containing protein